MRKIDFSYEILFKNKTNKNANTDGSFVLQIIDGAPVTTYIEIEVMFELLSAQPSAPTSAHFFDLMIKILRVDWITIS